MIVEAYGQLLRRLRRERKLTSAAVADAAGVTGSYVTNLEMRNHSRTGTLDVLRGLALGLGVDWVELLPAWIYDKGGTFLNVPRLHVVRPGRTSKKVYILTLLRRNWDRMTTADLQRICELLTGIHQRWPTN